jgi:antitoxin component YwqK of YwqJK toxin-antitoxin module
MEGDARDGKLHGHQTAWYENGQKKGEDDYRDDIQMQGWKDLDENGKPVGEKYCRIRIYLWNLMRVRCII